MYLSSIITNNSCNLINNSKKFKELDGGLWQPISYFLSLDDLTKCERLSKFIWRNINLNNEYFDRLREELPKIKEAFDGILELPLISKEDLNDMKCCKNYLASLKKIIQADEEIYKLWLENGKDYLATAQEMKDKDFLISFLPLLPLEIREQIDGKKTIRQAADFLREWMQKNKERFTNVKSFEPVNQKLRSIVSEIFLFCPNLEEMNFFNNRLTTLPKGLGSLRHLVRLNLGCNKLKDINALGSLNHLNILGLEKNQIEKIDSLKGLTELTRLSLANNKIETIAPLKSLVCLSALDLAYNPIKDCKAIWGLPNIQYVNYDASQMKAM
jgi:Leucine-rich repeat (LRR) protein